MVNKVETITCLILVAGYPIFAAILLFHQLKLKAHETQKKRKPSKKVLHGQPRRDPAVSNPQKDLFEKDENSNDENPLTFDQGVADFLDHVDELDNQKNQTK